MKCFSSRVARFLEVSALLLVVVAYCRPAHAYVDMGTGSYILQVSIAAVAGALFSLKIFWTTVRDRIKAAVSRSKAARTAPPAQHAE